jgi:site-specific DNA recombinase
MKSTASQPAKTIRCAIYTRKSTEEGLQQEFNTLDAQRESAEAYIASQKHQGWVCIPERYDDGGYSGGTIERPAFKRLMADVETGKVDAILVYKLDRLSRSLMDFARIMEVLEKRDVALVSITQSLDTKSSMGRLTMHILLSFAQFEREIISERTRDKIAAARRKGRFAGGAPILGYDIQSEPTGSKLIVNDVEAEQVRTIFALYLKHQALIPTVTEINDRGWTTKKRITRKGREMLGRPWGKTELFKLLTNVVYVGKVRYKDEVHPGLHTGIVDPEVWQRVQAVLQRNRRTGGALVRNKYGALLKGLLNCACCKCAMGHAYTQKDQKRYRYYVCMKAQKRGWKTCPTKSIPAGEIERFVVEQIRVVGQDTSVLATTIRQMRQHGERKLKELQAEERRLQRDLAKENDALARLAVNAKAHTNPTALATAQERVRDGERRATDIREQIVAISRELVDEQEVRSALSMFDPVWETLSPREQARVIQLLVERVDYDGKQGTVSVTFRPNGIKSLSKQMEE